MFTVSNVDDWDKGSPQPLHTQCFHGDGRARSLSYSRGKPSPQAESIAEQSTLLENLNDDAIALLYAR